MKKKLEIPPFKNTKNVFLPDLPYRISEVGHINMLAVFRKHKSLKIVNKKIITTEIEPELKLFLERLENNMHPKKSKKGRGINETESASNTPATSDNTATPASNTPATSDNTATPASNTPATSDNTATPASNTPATSDNTATPASNTPATSDNTATPASNTPATSDNTATPASNTPATTNNIVIKPTIELIKNLLVQLPLNKNDYMQDVYPKKQIYLHHTISWGNPTSAYNTWTKSKTRVATFAIIAGRPINKPNAVNEHKDGEIYQCFSSKHWAFHLGVKGSIELERQSIGIELANWGGLVIQPKSNGKLFTIPPAKNSKGVLEQINLNIPANEVIMYEKKYKDYFYYEKYTDKQLESLRKLLLYLCEVYQIPKKFNPAMFEVNKEALKGGSGIWTHTSVRADKSDCHPQPELIQMLKSL